MKYAVNLPDLTGRIQENPQEAAGLRVLVMPVIDRAKVIECEPGMFDGAGLELLCDERRAQAVIAVIRIKFKPHELRCYCSQSGNNWKRI